MLAGVGCCGPLLAVMGLRSYRAIGLCGCNGGNGGGGVDMATSSLVGFIGTSGGDLYLVKHIYAMKNKANIPGARALPPHPAAAASIGLCWATLGCVGLSCVSWHWPGLVVAMAVVLVVTWQDVIVDTSISNL